MNKNEIYCLIYVYDRSYTVKITYKLFLKKLESAIKEFIFEHCAETFTTKNVATLVDDIY